MLMSPLSLMVVHHNLSHQLRGLNILDTTAHLPTTILPLCIIHPSNIFHHCVQVLLTDPHHTRFNRDEPEGKSYLLSRLILQIWRWHYSNRRRTIHAALHCIRTLRSNISMSSKPSYQRFMRRTCKLPSNFRPRRERPWKKVGV